MVHLFEESEPHSAAGESGDREETEVEEPASGTKRMVRCEGFDLERDQPGDRISGAALHA